MAQKILGGQRDFSYGEVDVDLKRADDHPARKGGLRQMLNHRIHNSGVIGQRSGRRGLFVAPTTRVEEITMSPGNVFKLVFGNSFLNVYNSSGILVANFSNLGGGAVIPWTPATTGTIRYAQFGLSVYIAYLGVPPQVLTWDGVTTWTLINFAELTIGSQKRTWFYRISPQGIAILPSARTGAITVTANSPVWTPGHVGTRIRFVNRQIVITGYVSPTVVNGTVQEALPGAQVLTFAVDPRLVFSVGDVVNGATSGSKGIVTAISFGAGVGNLNVQLITTNTTITQFTPFSPGAIVSFVGESISGPGGSITAGSAGAIVDPNAAVTYWDDEVMNSLRGYPTSVFVDQFRVGFCNFPLLPNAIGWSSINAPTDLYVGGSTIPSGAMFELAPDKVQIQDVVPGPEGSEFVFCDRRVFYIPINETNPLRPGSVAFKLLTEDGAGNVMPRRAQEAILYCNAGLSTIMAVIATGAYQRPFATKSLTDYHAHLFSNIQCIACPAADGQFNERYAYVLNGNGSVAVGKYKPETLSGNEPVIGWGPWTGGGTVFWVSAWSSDVLFTTNYFGVATVCEILDDTLYLDGSVFVNAVPVGMAAPAGKGPLWWIANQSVFLMDGRRPLGLYQIDGNGNVIPQNMGGEDLTVVTLVAGQPFTTITEPFAAEANPGNDVGQRMAVRRVARFGASVIHSTGFLMARLFSGKVTRASPALGSVVNSRRFPAYYMDDDTSVAPPVRETTEKIRPIGRSYDPRVAIIRDTPGPMIIEELLMEVTV